MTRSSRSSTPSALDADAPVLRTDKPGKKDNHIWHWEAGDRAATDGAFAAADVVGPRRCYIPRIHVASIETCGCVADFDRVNGKLTVYMTTQAPHAIRTVFALVAGHVGLSEERSGSSRPTSAAASAARSRSIPATSSRWPRRS